MLTKSVPEDRRHRQAQQQERELKMYHQSPKKFVQHEIRISKLSNNCILKHCHWKSYITTIVRALNKDDSDQRVKFCK